MGSPIQPVDAPRGVYPGGEGLEWLAHSQRAHGFNDFAGDMFPADRHRSSGYCVAAETALQGYCANQNGGKWPLCASGMTVMRNTFPFVSSQHSHLSCAYRVPPLMTWGSSSCYAHDTSNDEVGVLVSCDLCVNTLCMNQYLFIIVMIVMGLFLALMCCCCSCITCRYRRRRPVVQSRDLYSPAGVQLQSH
uniref:Uncharacterized protein n=1 Tax=Noctiluca scintillans TaxID=2966 RepID=A0A7S1ALJ0_NOCSC|mmetsp:Transcript_5130/g.14350  ORF Transcript_5130/g.14350 Transcript_5130/m.14350 type:complete len:191 (+) Transcript_5130:86-658(+)